MKRPPRVGSCLQLQVRCRHAGQRGCRRPGTHLGLRSDRAIATLIAIVAVVLALMISAGSRNPGALLLLGIAAALLVASRSLVPSEPSNATWVAAIGCCSIAFFFNADLFGNTEVLFAAVVVIGVMLALRWRFSVGVAIVAAASLVASTEPWRWGVGLFDVFYVEAAAAARLLHGGNPYSATIYDRVPIAPGVLAVGPEHFPFGPLVPVASLPGALFGDIRLASILWAIGAGAVVILLARQSRLSLSSRRMLLLLTVASPLIPTMVVTAWPETLLIAMFGLSIALHRRHPVWMVMAIAACLLVVPTAPGALLPVLRVVSVLAAAHPGGLTGRTWRDVRLQHRRGRPSALVPTQWCATSGSRRTMTASPSARASSWRVGAQCRRGSFQRPSSRAAWLSCGASQEIRRDLCVAAAFLFLVSTIFASYARFNFYYVVAATLLLALASFGVDPGSVGVRRRTPDDSKASLATATIAP